MRQQIWGEVVDFILAFFSLSENVKVKTLLKSVHIYQSYCKKNLAQFFLAHPVHVGLLCMSHLPYSSVTVLYIYSAVDYRTLSQIAVRRCTALQYSVAQCNRPSSPLSCLCWHHSSAVCLRAQAHVRAFARPRPCCGDRALISSDILGRTDRKQRVLPISCTKRRYDNDCDGYGTYRPTTRPPIGKEGLTQGRKTSY